MFDRGKAYLTFGFLTRRSTIIQHINVVDSTCVDNRYPLTAPFSRSPVWDGTSCDLCWDYCRQIDAIIGARSKLSYLR